MPRWRLITAAAAALALLSAAAGPLVYADPAGADPESADPADPKSADPAGAGPKSADPAGAGPASSAQGSGKATGSKNRAADSAATEVGSKSGSPPLANLTLQAPVDKSAGKLWSAVGLGGLYVGLGTWAYFAWYHNQDELPSFEVGGDGWFGRETYAAGADKMGHFWANYAITRGSTKLLKLGGWDTLPASIISGSLAWTFFAFVEIKDGFYYQLSIGDTVGNTVGVLLGALLENVPAIDRMVDFQLEYFPSSDYRREFADNGDLDVAEDYSGQTYLVALHLKALPGLTDPDWMRWARYVDVVGGFESRNYLPEPEESARRQQSIFLGLSLNLQHALEELWGGPPKQLGHQIGHGIFELYSPPYTTVRVTESTRFNPGDARPTSN